MNAIASAPLLNANSMPGGAASKPKSQLDMEVFLRLLTVQLSTQNPLEPMNDRDFFAQLAQLGTVQGLDKMQDSMDVARAQSMMGRMVTAVRPGGGSPTDDGMVTGIVKTLTMRNGEYYLGIQEADGGLVEVKMDSVTSVSPANELANAANLIGKRVTGFIEETVNGVKRPVEFTGEVKSVQLKNGQYTLTVEGPNGRKVEMILDAVTRIQS